MLHTPASSVDRPREEQEHAAARSIPPSTGAPARPSRPRPSSWPTSPPTTPPARPRTPWRSSTATRPRSAYGQVVGWSELPTAGNELHHFGWNACSSALCHQGHGDHGQPLERRYLIVPGLRSSRTYVLDTKPDPRNPKVVRDHRGRGAGRQGRLLPPPHRPLRPRRHLHVEPGRGQRQRRPRRGRPAGPRHLRRDRRLGARPRRPVLRLRRLVAPEPRHRHHLRVGHPVDDRERPQPRGPAGPQVRPPPQLLDACRSASSPSASTWATSTRWCWRSARPTTRPRPGGSSAWSSASRTSRGRSGPVAPRRRPLGGQQGHHHPGRAGRPRPAAAGPQAVRGGAPADQRHRPVGGRPLAVRVVLGHRRAQAVRRQRPRPTRARPARSAWAASSAASPTPPRPTSRWPAAPRWSRSAGTAGGCTSPTRCTGPGTTSSTPTGSGPGWPSWTPTSTAGGLTADPGFFPNGGRLPRPAGPPDPPPGRRRLQRLLLLHPLTRTRRQEDAPSGPPRR